MHKCLDYDLNDKLSRDECAEVYPKMWEYVTKLEARIAELEDKNKQLFADAYCYEDELPCDISPELFEQSTVYFVRLYPWRAVAMELEEELSAKEADDE